MDAIENLIRLLKGGGFSASGQPPAGSAGASSSSSATASGSAAKAAAQIFATKQSDESRVAIGSFGPDGQAPQHREEIKHEGSEMKVMQTDFKVPTCTGELVAPKQICVACFNCHGLDSVVTHCVCGAALCRRCVRHHPADGSTLCPRCYQHAIENFNVWAARDQQTARTDPR